MMRMLWMLLSVACVATLASAQHDLSGFYLHKTFIDSMKVKRSFVRALPVVRSPQPLAMAMTAADQAKYTARVFSSPVDSTGTVIERRLIKSLGEHYVIGRFIITYDTLSMEYIALVHMDSLEAPPIVYARIPSKRTDAGFVLQRAANSAMVSGTWKDTKGRTFTFGKDMIAKWPQGTFPYVLNTGEYSESEDMLLDATPGSTKRYILEFSNGTLQIYAASVKKGRLTRGKKIHTLRRQQ